MVGVWLGRGQFGKYAHVYERSGIDENAYDDEHIFNPAYGFPMKLNFFSPWVTSLYQGTAAKLKGYTRMWAPEKNKVVIYVILGSPVRHSMIIGVVLCISERHIPSGTGL